MDTFTKLFGSLVAFVYHCFDRIVILGYLPLLTRPENIVHFFREVHQVSPITKEVLRARTDDYVRWVESFARNHKIPIEWAGKGVRKEDYVRPRLQKMEREARFGVYFILKSMEVGPSFRISLPKYPTKDPNYRIVAPQKSRYRHIYFYIRDPVVGPMAMCVGTFLPFRISYWLNGHSFIERELLNKKVAFRKDDNAFLSTSDPQALQAAADRLSAAIIRKRLDYWTFLIGPKFSKKDRHAVNLSRQYSIQQIEYCRNLIFRRNFPIHKLYERSCDMGLMRLVPDKISQVFGFRVNKRLRGKLQSVLERVDHGHHVLRACAKNAVIRMYEKFSTFLRLEALSNNLRDFGLRKSLEHLDSVRKTLAAVTDRFAAFEAEALSVHVDFPLFQRVAKPVLSGKTRVPGIKLHERPHDPSHGGHARWSNDDPCVANRRSSSGHPESILFATGRVHHHPASLRPAQDEGPWFDRTRRQALRLSPDRQGQQSRSALRPLPQTRLWPSGEQSVRTCGRRAGNSCSQAHTV